MAHRVYGMYLGLMGRLMYIAMYSDSRLNHVEFRKFREFGNGMGRARSGVYFVDVGMASIWSTI